MYPNLFIVGSAKSGTTTLWQILKRHKQVFMPEDELHKEPGYFSINYRKMSLEDYLFLFDTKNKNYKWVGEASTSYLTCPEAAERIYKFNNDAKIIILLRNPVERAYSLYNWMVQEGYEYASTFEKALELESRRKNKKIPNFFEPEYYYNYLYFESGLYYRQVKRYLDLFGNNVLTIKLDDFKTYCEKTCEDIYNFLNIEPIDYLTANEIERHNVSMSVYSPKCQFFLRKVNKFFVNIRLNFSSKGIATKISRDRLLKIGIRNSKPQELKTETRRYLINKYKRDVALLSELTYTDFNNWTN